MGLLVFTFAHETKGHGVPEVMESVNLRGGSIRARVALVKIVVSSITISSGGSAGREGPIAQIGATVGSIIGRLSRVGREGTKLLVMAGLAAGIGGTFNAPLGGAIFALEVINPTVEPGMVIPVFLSSVVGTAVAQEFLGTSPVFSAPDFSITNPAELILFIPLGVAFGLSSVGWVKTFYKVEDLFNKLRISPKLKPALGGLATGAIGVFTLGYGIMGVGYEGVELAAAGKIALLMLLSLGLAKIVATSFTIGSGGSGGIFAPSLFIGMMFGNSHLLPPLMISASTSYFVASLLMKSSIYTLKLEPRGVRVRRRRDLLQTILVKEVMTPARKVVKVKPESPVSVVAEYLWEYGHNGYPVVDGERIVGIITSSDVKRVAPAQRRRLTVAEVATKKLVVAYPEETVLDALEKMTGKDVGRLPVVERKDPTRLLGIITKKDVMRAYKMAELDSEMGS